VKHRGFLLPASHNLRKDLTVKNLLLSLLAVCLSAPALACPVSESLVEQFGISFFGFERPIPVASAPKVLDDGSFVRVRLPDDGTVMDGFYHTAVVDTKGKKAWILRTGGILSVYQWYGPVDVDNVSTVGCALEPVSPDTRTPSIQVPEPWPAKRS
jgi:hypothetical protein